LKKKKKKKSIDFCILRIEKKMEKKNGKKNSDSWPFLHCGENNDGNSLKWALEGLKSLLMK